MTQQKTSRIAVTNGYLGRSVTSGYALASNWRILRALRQALAMESTL